MQRGGRKRISEGNKGPGPCAAAGARSVDGRVVLVAQCRAAHVKPEHAQRSKARASSRLLAQLHARCRTTACTAVKACMHSKHAYAYACWRGFMPGISGGSTSFFSPPPRPAPLPSQMRDTSMPCRVDRGGG